MVSAALCLALAMVLPFLTGQIQQIGNMLCPMHFPVLLCGFICGWQYGLAIGFIAPILRFAIFGMPPIMPIGLAMAFELACYGLVVGLMYSRLKKTKGSIYISLICAMISGRLVWGLVKMIIAGVTRTGFTFAAFLAGAFTSAIPGIIAQLVLIPIIVITLEKNKVI